MWQNWKNQNLLLMLSQVGQKEKVQQMLNRWLVFGADGPMISLNGRWVGLLLLFLSGCQCKTLGNEAKQKQ